MDNTHIVKNSMSYAHRKGCKMLCEYLYSYTYLIDSKMPISLYTPCFIAPHHGSTTALSMDLC